MRLGDERECGPADEAFRRALSNPSSGKTDHTRELLAAVDTSGKPEFNIAGTGDAMKRLQEKAKDFEFGKGSRV